MLTFLAYAIVIVLTRFACFFGEMIVGFPVALALAWTSQSWRVIFAGLISGTAGILTSVMFGYYVFSWLVGPQYFTLGPFLASTLPLLIPIWGDIKHASAVTEARMDLLKKMESKGSEALERMAEATATPFWLSLIGKAMGIVYAVRWFNDGF